VPSPSSAAVWSAVHAERRALITELESLTLTPEQWARPSLCPGWDIHDVLAHLVDAAKTTRLGFVRGLIAAKFDFDRECIEAALRYQLKTGAAVGGGKESATGFRLRAADSALDHGSGPEVTGGSLALLMAVSGRPLVDGELSGEGAAAFAHKLGPTPH
jgi:hypothetical protein